MLATLSFESSLVPNAGEACMVAVLSEVPLERPALCRPSTAACAITAINVLAALFLLASGFCEWLRGGRGAGCNRPCCLPCTAGCVMAAGAASASPFMPRHTPPHLFPACSALGGVTSDGCAAVHGSCGAPFLPAASAAPALGHCRPALHSAAQRAVPAAPLCRLLGRAACAAVSAA